MAVPALGCCKTHTVIDSSTDMFYFCSSWRDMPCGRTPFTCKCRRELARPRPQRPRQPPWSRACRARWRCVPQPWRDWIADTERATGAPADYVLQSVLAGVAAVCGAGVRVRVTPAWDEPLVLWQAVVGEPSTGKSAALAPMRRLLDVVEQERRLGDEERRAAHDERGKAAGKGTDGDAAPSCPRRSWRADRRSRRARRRSSRGNPRGLLLWRDGPARGRGWIARRGRRGRQPSRDVARGLGGAAPSP